MAMRLFGAKPLPEPTLAYCQLDPQEQTSVKFESNTKFSLKKVSSAKWRPFLFRGDDLWLLLICTGGEFLIKNISSSHWKGTFHYTT